MEQATDGAETAAIYGRVSSWSQNIFCLILSMGTKIRINSVMRPRSSSRGRNTSALVTVTVTVTVSRVRGISPVGKERKRKGV